MSSLMMTSHLPAFFVNWLFSVLNRAIVLPNFLRRLGPTMWENHHLEGTVTTILNIYMRITSLDEGIARPAYKPQRADVKHIASSKYLSDCGAGWIFRGLISRYERGPSVKLG
jgi:hypothetical protein